ncbi:YcbK family protein [Sphingomonas qilianensis]|uniref:Murein endopeptidase K n=1 Tax=Sphingomonas qilianensis TaxID=1736690 RepID=A0ABU9XNF6_9SPHN
MQTTTNSRLVSHPSRLPELSRRSLIGGAALGGMAAMMPLPAMAAGSEWRLAIRNVHNNETVDAVFARSGQFLASGLAELNHGLRDWRTGETTQMDRRLLALLVQLRDKLDLSGRNKIELISGYRSPKTNAALRARGGENTGVASTSQHMLGKATDIVVPGVTLDKLRGAALALGGGGVGYYPRDGFVHVDTGRVRHW